MEEEERLQRWAYTERERERERERMIRIGRERENDGRKRIRALMSEILPSRVLLTF